MLFTILKTLYPSRIKHVQDVSDLPNNVYLVYILTFNHNTIVLGHGKKIEQK
jgi:hypothetical protein